ncbi:hypothetical protein [Lapillicoccus jejuensis]|uniref:Uncharacterized protein n=1 Tax=Lapillicoccus jejuensis TaxID=402171 RepID=A0A542DXZ9_9MICO|nr:hypothetical protein [Lapillicoccus jejuensis]TQJ07956.1 hypothetical protein FB458_1028 [Lapillicoccus jejuensis]
MSDSTLPGSRGPRRPWATTYRGLPLVASTADLERHGGFRAQDRLFVADRVVAAAVRTAVQDSGLVVDVGRVRLRIEPGPGGDRCAGVAVEVTAPYGAPLGPLADRLRPVLLDALTDVLGPAERTADVHVDDVSPATGDDAAPPAP